MSRVKIFDKDQKKWVTVASSRASEILVTDKTLCTDIDEDGKIVEKDSTNVEKVLGDMKESLDMVQSNVAWLALHGGGGASGGGGGGGGGTVSGYITVNSITQEVGSVTLDDSGLYIELKVSGSSGWAITATSGRTQIAYAANAKTLSITNSILESKGLTTSFPFSVSAYNSESLTTLYWTGTIVINTVSVVCDETINVDFTKVSDTNLTYRCTSGALGAYVLYINGKKMGDSFNVSPAGVDHTVSMGDLGLAAGSNTIVARLENAVDSSIYGEYTSLIVCETGSPIIVSSALSQDASSPTKTELYSSNITVGLPFVVYYNAGSSSTFKYSICMNNDTPAWDKIDSFNYYNTSIGNASYYISDAKVTGSNIKFTIYIRDTASGLVYSNSYYILLTEPESKYIDEDQVVTEDTVFDFSTSVGTIVNKVWTDNNHVHKMASSIYKNQPYTINIQQINAYSNSIQSSTNTVGPYLRLQNASYGVIPLCKGDIESWVVGGSAQFTIELCFHADYHPDDDRIIFQWGNLQNLEGSGYVTSAGIVVRTHDVYVAGEKLFSLEDDENIHLTFAYRANNGDGLLFTYLDGVIESVISTKNNSLLPWLSDSSASPSTDCSMYIGAGYYNGESISYTDTNIFHVKLLNYCMNPYQVLTDYLNDQSRTIYSNGNPDMSLIAEGKLRNFIDDNGSSLYDTSVEWVQTINNENFLDVFSLSNFVTMDGTTAHLNANIKNYTVPIPVVFLDVSANSLWTWENFTTPQSQTSTLQAVEAAFEYYDQKLDKSSIVGPGTVTVEQQGTSTLADYIKNLNITFPDGTTFIPKESWFPEQTYTLKADIVDSSHSLNTSIGKFVNEELGLDRTTMATKWYPYSETVLKSFVNQKNNSKSAIQTYFPNATLKHGVEGFPIFLIMKFATTPGSSDTGVHTLGIYQFILGRKSPRNLGYEIITSVTDTNETPITTMHYPFLDSKFSVNTNSNRGVWAEFSENGSWGASFDFQGAGDKNFVGAAMTGAFWQPTTNAPDYYEQYVEVKYHNLAQDPIITSFTPFTDFVNAVTKLPVNYKRYSEPRGGFSHSNFNGRYDGYKYTKDSQGQYVWVKGGSEVQSAGRGDDLQGVISDNINLECISKYQALGMFWGLMDNFQKNMPMKFYQATDGSYEKALLGIYDTDTGCGQTNQAAIVNNEHMWFTGLKNTSAMCLTECPSSLGVNKATAGGTIIADNNKLWTLDTDDLQYSVYGETKKQCSLFANMWHSLRMLKPNLASDFYNNYFLPQTEGCGELLFNLTYIAKYITKYQASATSTEKSNQIEKLHGRRRYQVKRWLEKRVKFLDGMYDAMGIGTTMGIQGYTVGTAAFNAATSPSMAIKTNSPIIVHYDNQGSDDRYVICDTNIPTDIYMGSTELTSDPDKSHMISNPSSIIQLGDGDHPLYDVGFSAVKTGSFPYMSEYNVSAPNRSSSNMNVLGQMNADYMYDRFTNGTTDTSGAKAGTSELRTIDFRNTYPRQTDYVYNLNLEKGFKKLQNLYINNSCITNVIFPTDVSLRDINIAGSRLSELTLDSQGFISELSLSGCSNLSQLNINSCDSLKSITVDSSNTSLQTVNISSNGLETFKATNVNTMTSVSVTSSNLKSVYISNCQKLTKLNICVDNVSEIYVANCPALETLEFNTQQEGVTSFGNLTSLRVISCQKFKGTYLGGKDVLQAAGTPFSSADYASVQIVDVSRFPNLTTTSFYGDASVEYVQFKNDVNNPYVISNVYTGSTTASPFYGCTSLVRVFGNVKCNANSIFADDIKFSIHGYDCVTTTWRGKSVINTEKTLSTGLGRVMIPAEVMGAITNAESTSIESSVVNSTITKVKNFNATTSNFYQSGKRVTNLTATTGYGLFSGTSCSLFDMYYFFANIGSCTNCASAFSFNKTATAWGSNYAKSAQFNMNSNNSSPDNSPNRYMFVSCDKVTSLASCWYGCSSDGFRLFTPITTTGNNGLFSPLTSCKSLSYTFAYMKYITDNKVFRRASGNYALTNIDQLMPLRIVSDVNSLTSYSMIPSPDSDGDLSGFFNNLNNLTTCKALFNNLIFVNFDLTRTNGGFKIPSKVTTLTSFLQAYAGTGTMLAKNKSIGDEYFMTPAAVVNIYQSFRVTNNSYGYSVDLYISNNFFQGFSSQLQRVGYTSEGDMTGSCTTASFGGAAVNKYIQGSTFPESILNNLTGLKQFSGFFMNAQFESGPSGDVALPGVLFKNNTKLQDCRGVFYGVKFDYKLSETDISAGNNFVNCTGLLHVDYAFARGGVNTSSSKGLKGCYIPNKFFYHGMDATKTTLYGTNKTWVESVALNDNQRISGDNYIVTTKSSNIYDKTTVGYIPNSVIGKEASVSGYYYLTESTGIYSDAEMSGDPFATLQSGSVVKKGDVSGVSVYVTAATEVMTTKVDTYVGVSPENNTGTAATITRLPSTMVNTTTTEVSSDGGTDVNTFSGYYGNVMLPDTTSKSSVSYYVYTLQSTIKSMEGCFQGADLLPYDHTSISLDDIEDYYKFSPFDYSYNPSTNVWSNNTTNKCTTLHTYMWVYDGNPNNSLPSLSGLKGKENVSDYNSTYDSSWHHIDEVNYTNKSRFKEDHPYAGMPSTLNYCCPPDLFRYCTADCLISRMFSGSGVEYSGGGPGWTKNYNAGTENITAWGIYGRIPPYLLLPVSRTTDIRYMFYCCRRLSSYSDSQEDKSYIIPKHFFQYATSASNMTYAFAGVFMPSNIDLNVFEDISNSTTLNLDHAFWRTCYGDGATIRDCFASKNVSNINYCFARISSQSDISGSMDFPTYAMDEGVVTFNNVFNNKYNNITSFGQDTTKTYAFSGFNVNGVVHEDPKTLVNTTTTNNYVYKGGTYPE